MKAIQPMATLRNDAEGLRQPRPSCQICPVMMNTILKQPIGESLACDGCSWDRLYLQPQSLETGQWTRLTTVHDYRETIWLDKEVS
jgi:hypothetical protein